jgi:hypothetical protein
MLEIAIALIIGSALGYGVRECGKTPPPSLTIPALELA